MKQGNTCSLENPNLWMVFLQHRLHWSSTSSDHTVKEDMCGVNLWRKIPSYWVPHSLAGSGMKVLLDGYQSGPPCNRHMRCAMSWYNATVRNLAEVCANATWANSAVLHFATVKEIPFKSSQICDIICHADHDNSSFQAQLKKYKGTIYDLI